MASNQSTSKQARPKSLGFRRSGGGQIDPCILERKRALALNAKWDGLEVSSDDENETVSVPARAINRAVPQPPPIRAVRVPQLATDTDDEDVSPRANTEEAFFSGDIDAYVGKAMAYVQKDTAGQGTEYDRLTVWAAVVGAGPVPATVINRRVPTVYEDRAARLAAGNDEEVSHRTRVITGQRQPKGTNSGSPTQPDGRKKKKALSVRASAVARQIKDDPLRIMGVLGTGGNNRRWAAAVAQALMKLGVGDGTVKGWRSQIIGSLEVKPHVGATVVKKTVELWAINNPEVTMEEELEAIEDQIESTPKEDATAIARLNQEKREIETAMENAMDKEDKAAYAFAYILGSNNAAGCIRGQRVCPFCIFFELSGAPNRDITLTPSNRGPEWRLVDRLTHSEMGAGWVNAAAEAHNAEMHAKNGNIDSVASGMAAREGRFQAIRDLFWDQACEMTHEDGPNQAVTYETLLSTPAVYYARGPDRSSRALTNAGTLHQYFCPGIRSEGGGYVIGPAPRILEGDVEDSDSEMGACGGVPCSCSPQKGTEEATGTAGGGEDETAQAVSSAISDISRVLQNIGALRKETMTGGGPTTAEQPSVSEGSVQGGVLRRPRKKIAINIPPPAVKDQGTQMEPPRLIGGREAWDRLKWVGIGVDPRLKHGSMVRTEAAATILEAATNPAPSCPGVINPAKGLYTYGYMSNTPLLAAGLDAYLSGSKADYRGLAIKIDLYDELRERRMVQPTGVGYAWATSEEPEKVIQSTRVAGDWAYQAVFITADVLEAMLRNGGDLLVGGRGGEVWNLRQDSVRVVPLADNGEPDCIGRDAWIVSHLTYPLAQVFDTYEVAVVGDRTRNGNQRVRRETFVRTAGLIDIADRASKIIFVIPTKTSSSVSFGGVVYDIQSCDHRGELPRDRVIVSHNVNDALETAVRRLLTTTKSLRTCFSDYTASYFPKGINWLEINSVTVSLTVRWHQKI